MWEVVLLLVLAVVPIVFILLAMTMAARLVLTALELTNLMLVVPSTVLAVLTPLIRFPALTKFRVPTSRLLR